jgi:hypothetical protein
MGYLRFKIVYSDLQDTDSLYDELEILLRKRQETRDRRLAEQITLPIDPADATAAPRRRRATAR